MFSSKVNKDAANFEYEDICSIVSDSNLDGFVCKRILGFRKKDGSVLSWQCNQADIQNFDVKLPTTVKIDIEEGNIKDIELLDNFKGSQGIPCSRKYLNRRMKENLIGEEFRAKNKKLQDSLLLACRHLHELVIGAVNFNEKADEFGTESYQEVTGARITDTGLEIRDRVKFLDKLTELKVDVVFNKKDLVMDDAGELVQIKELHLKSYIIEDGEEVLVREDSVSDIKSSMEASLTMMKVFSRLWKFAGKSVGVEKNYYFSNLWPSTLYGIFVQSVALVLYQNNYAYFQHALSGIQRGRGKPQCIGIVSNIDEAVEFFPDFDAEDLYD